TKPLEQRMFALSHDGQKAVLDIGSGTGDFADLWIHDLQRGAMTRFTFASGSSFAPIWSPDDSKIVYSSGATAGADLVMKSSSGAGSEEPLVVNRNFKVACDWSKSGLLAYTELSPKTQFDIWLMSVADRKVRVLVQTPFGETNPHFSPD